MPRTKSVVSPRRSPRQRLARQLGAEADVARGLALAPALEELEHRAGELEAEKHRQRAQVGRLEAHGCELADTLAAARAMNRELMKELNRHPRRDRGSTATASESWTGLCHLRPSRWTCRPVQRRGRRLGVLAPRLGLAVVHPPLPTGRCRQAWRPGSCHRGSTSARSPAASATTTPPPPATCTRTSSPRPTGMRRTCWVACSTTPSSRMGRREGRRLIVEPIVLRDEDPEDVVVVGAAPMESAYLAARHSTPTTRSGCTRCRSSWRSTIGWMHSAPGSRTCCATEGVALDGRRPPRRRLRRHRHPGPHAPRRRTARRHRSYPQQAGKAASSLESRIRRAGHLDRAVESTS